MARIITSINNKGGVGKTSSCTTIGSLLGILGYRCLIVDNDFQSNATATFLNENDNIAGTVRDLFVTENITRKDVEECILHTSYKNVDLIPACPEHVDTDEYLYSLPKEEVYTKLKKALQHIQDDYDYIMIDTHPDLYGVTKNALCCSDYVMTPVGADGYSFQGTAPITNSILKISDELNPGLSFLGAFMTSVDTRTSAYKNYYSFYESQLGDDFLHVAIRRDSSIAAVPSWLLPLPYLLGDRDFRSTSKWKGIYDYIDLMYDVGMISEDDYMVIRGIFEIADGKLLIELSNEPNVRIKSVHLAAGVRDDFQNEYVKENLPHYKDLVRTLNENESLKTAVKEGLITVMNEDRLIKLYTRKLKFPYVKIKSLKED